MNTYIGFQSPQGRATSGPRAGYGPRMSDVRPAAGIGNLHCTTARGALRNRKSFFLLKGPSQVPLQDFSINLFDEYLKIICNWVSLLHQYINALVTWRVRTEHWARQSLGVTRFEAEGYLVAAGGGQTAKNGATYFGWGYRSP